MNSKKISKILTVELDCFESPKQEICLGGFFLSIDLINYPLFAFLQRNRLKLSGILHCI
jgi:hypothetical protein